MLDNGKLDMFDKYAIKNFKTEFVLPYRIVGYNGGRAYLPVEIDINLRFYTDVKAYENPKYHINGWSFNLNTSIGGNSRPDMKEFNEVLKNNLNYLENKDSIKNLIENIDIKNIYKEKNIKIINTLKKEEVQKYLMFKSYLEGVKKLMNTEKEITYPGSKKQIKFLKENNIERDYTKEYEFLKKHHMEIDPESGFNYGYGWTYDLYSFEEIKKMLSVLYKYFVENPIKIFSLKKNNPEVKKLFTENIQFDKYKNLFDNLKINKKEQRFVENLREITIKLKLLAKEIKKFEKQQQTIKKINNMLKKEKDKIKEDIETSNRQYIVITEKGQNFLIDRNGNLTNIKNIKYGPHDRILYELENGEKQEEYIVSPINRKIKTIMHVM